MKKLEKLNLIKQNEKEIKLFIKTCNILEERKKIIDSGNQIKEIVSLLKKDWSKKLGVKSKRVLRPYIEFLNKLLFGSYTDLHCENIFVKENINYARLEMDHIKPKSKGGKDILSNFQLITRTENAKKGAKEIEKKADDLIIINSTTINFNNYQEEIFKKGIKNLSIDPQQLDLISIIYLFEIILMGNISNEKEFETFIKENKNLEMFAIKYFNMCFFESKNEKKIKSWYKKYNIDFSTRNPNLKEILYKKIKKSDADAFEYKKDMLRTLKDREIYFKEFTKNKMKKSKSIINCRTWGYIKTFYKALNESLFFNEFKNRNEDLKNKDTVKEMLEILKYCLNENLEERSRNKAGKFYVCDSVNKINIPSTIQRRYSSIKRLVKQIESFLA